jgi:chromosome segregation ATPase
MLQRLQIKQGLYNEAMKNGADTVDVSDIDTSELKTALITDQETRADIELMIEKGRLESEKTQVGSDLAFIHRKFERFNELNKKLQAQEKTLQQYEEWAKTDPYWARQIDREKQRYETAVKELENEKQHLAQRGVDVDNIVAQEQNSKNTILEIERKIEALKERKTELVAQYTEENRIKAQQQGDVVKTYVQERAAENKSGFFVQRSSEPRFKISKPIYDGTKSLTDYAKEVSMWNEQILPQAPKGDVKNTFGSVHEFTFADEDITEVRKKCS